MGRKFDLPEGYKSVAQLLKEFREKYPTGVIKTEVVSSSDGFVIVAAAITAGELSATGIADAELRQGKGSSRAESAAIRRALVHLGFDSVEIDDDSEVEEEEEEQPKRFSRSSVEEEVKPKRSFVKADDKEKSAKQEMPHSRFALKPSNDEAQEAEEQEQSAPKFERGSRFKRG